MSEREFIKFKKWVITVFGAQFLAIIVAGLISWGSISSTIANHGLEIKELKTLKVNEDRFLECIKRLDEKYELILNEQKKTNDKIDNIKK